MKNMKTISVAIVLILSLVLAACGSNNNGGNGGNAAGDATGGATGNTSGETAANGGSDKKVKLTIYSTVNDQALKDYYVEIANAYTKENPNVTFEFQNPGNDYENILRMKMAANDLPDIFDTHGWAINRYGEYLEDLSKQPWVADISESMKPIITDEAGKVYVLPLNAAKDGITYQKDVLEKYGIEVPKTIDELIAAGEKIKKDSNGEVAPFYFSGPDAASMAQFFDYFSTSLLISPKQNSAQQLLDGTFDWNKWTPLAAKFKEMYDTGLINEDVLTSRESDRPRLFAEGKIAFVFGGPGFIPDAQKINPEVGVGIMPVPAFFPDDEPTFSGGERFTMGVFKDGKNKDIAIDVVNFFAKPEYLKRISELSGTPTAMNGITPDLGIYTEFYDKYKDIRVFPYFDRVYLPGGMWDVMQTTSAEILGGTLSPEESSNVYKENYELLRSQQK